MKFKFSIFDGPQARDLGLHDQKACRLDVGALLVDVVASHGGAAARQHPPSHLVGSEINGKWAERERERERVLLNAVADPDGFDVLESKCAAGAGFTRHCQP